MWYSVDNYSHASEYVSEYYKTWKMCDKFVDAYRPAIQFFYECCKDSKKMCDKAAYTCPFVFDSAPDQDKVQGMCVKLFPKNF